MSSSRAARVVVAWLLLAPWVRAGDWPHLRGPSYNGHSAETGLADTWPDAGPPVVWRIELGQGYSGFAVVGDRLYTQYQSLSGQYVVCLEAQTGRRLWRYRTGYPWEPDGNWPGPMATPTVYGGRVYFVDAFGLAGCLAARNGRSLWSLNVTEKFDGEGTEYGYACSPLVKDGRVYLPVGGKGAALVALSASNGSVAWASGDDVASYSPAYPITVGGQRQIVVYMRNFVVAYEPATGRELWRHQWSEGYDEHAAWPAYEEPFLLTASAFKLGAKVLRLGRTATGATAKLVWHSKALSNDILSSIVLDGHIYGFDLHDLQPRETRRSRGQFKCLELATGGVRWATDCTGHASVLVADGKLILLNETGELILARATPERYEELARARVLASGMCWTPPSLSQGQLYVRSHKHAACIYLGRDPEAVVRAAASAPARDGAAGRFAERLSAAWTGAALYAPTLTDFLKWYGWCLAAAFLPAAVLGLVAHASCLRCCPGRSVAARCVVGGVVLLLSGALGTVALTWATKVFVFTWPCSLYAALHGLTVAAATAATARSRRGRWLVRVALVAFAGLCYGYYVLCRSLFVVMGYGFLTGLLPGFPVAWLAARRMASRPGPWRDLLWPAASFTFYFWASAFFTVWRTQS